MKKLALSIVLLIIGFTYKAEAQKLLSKEDAFIAVIGFNGGNVQHYINEYIYRFDSKNFQAYQEDEFEMAKTIKELQNKLKNSQPNQEYYITYKANFGMYSFEKNEFSFDPFPEGTSIELFNFIFSPRVNTNTNTQLVFSNGAEITSLPMEFDNANFLVKMRKDKRSGKIDRTIHLKVYFNLRDYYEYEDLSQSRQKVTLFANITKIETFENEAFLSDPLSVISTEYFLAKQKLENEEKKKKDEAKVEVKTVNELNQYLSEQNIDKELKAKIMKTAVTHFNE